MTNDQQSTPLARRHLRFGWWALLVFLSLGIVIEALHGFKVGLYMEVANATRRHMWTLAHAHGTLLAVINLVFATSLRSFPELFEGGTGKLASRLLIAASVLLPGGFFLGGFWFHGGDPGLGILLLPLAAALLLIAVLTIARAASSRE